MQSLHLLFIFKLSLSRSLPVEIFFKLFFFYAKLIISLFPLHHKISSKNTTTREQTWHRHREYFPVGFFFFPRSYGEGKGILSNKLLPQSHALFKGAWIDLLSHLH